MQNSIKEISLVVDDVNEVINEDSTLILWAQGATNGQTFMDLCLGEYSQGFSVLNWDTIISGCFMFQPEIIDGEMYVKGVNIKAYCKETKTLHAIKALKAPFLPETLKAEGEAYDAAVARMVKFDLFLDSIKNPKQIEKQAEAVPVKFPKDLFIKDAKEYIHAGYELFEFEKDGKKILFLFLNGLKTKYKELVRSKEIMAELFEDGNYQEWNKLEAVIGEDGNIAYTFKRGADEVSFTIDTNKMEVVL